MYSCPIIILIPNMQNIYLVAVVFLRGGLSLWMLINARSAYPVFKSPFSYGGLSLWVLINARSICSKKGTTLHTRDNTVLMRHNQLLFVTAMKYLYAPFSFLPPARVRDIENINKKLKISTQLTIKEKIRSTHISYNTHTSLLRYIILIR